MKTKEQIRNDLKNIRYYYMKKEKLDAAFAKTGENGILTIVGEYHKIMCKASPQLYDVYVSLYVRGITQESTAEELDYSTFYIYKLNNRLINFLYSAFN